jgi:O-antigen/teichoic acid export membrane protein
VGVRSAFIALTGGQFVALIAAYATHITLARFLGAADYGNYGVLVNAVSTTTTLLVAGLPEAIAKLASAEPASVRAIAQRGIRIQVQLALALACIYAVAAPIVSRVLRDPELSPYLAASALAIPPVALMAVAQGILNGEHRFGAQALLVAGGAVARCAAVVVLALRFHMAGAVAGLVVAPMLVLALALPAIKPWGEKPDTSHDDELVRFAKPVVVFTVVLALLMNLDLFAVKAFANTAERVGHYTAAATIGKVPYLMLSSLGVVLLPVLSAADAKKDETRQLVRSAFRALVLGSLLVVAALVPLSAPILHLLYGESYAWASTPLALLLASGTLFTLFFVVSYALYGVGRPRLPMQLTLVGLAVEGVLLAMLIGSYRATGAAAASCVTATLLFGASLVAARADLGNVLPLKTLLRGTAAFAVTVGVGITLVGESTSSSMIFYGPLLGVVNLAALFLTGETNPKEILSLLHRSQDDG